MKTANEAADKIAAYIESMFAAPSMFAQSTEALEMSLIAVMQCWHYASGADNDNNRVYTLWREEVRQIHGGGASAKTLCDLPGGGKAMHMDCVTIPLRRIWLALSDPVTSIGSVKP